MSRDLAIDATRGLAIWSMISLHFANGMLIALPTHAFPLVDGMSAFVLLSGLVLGLVYRGWTERHGLRFAYQRLAQRLLVLYFAQVVISLVAVAVATVLSGREYFLIARLPGDEPFLQQLWWALTLRFLPGGGNILVVYLVLMTFAFAVVPLLMREHWRWVLAASGALYLVSQVSPAWWMYLNAAPDGGPIQNWAAWQVLFIPAMVVGWQWSRWQVRDRLDALLPRLAAVTVLVGVVLAHGLWIERWLWRAPELLGKVELGPLRVLASWLVVACVYAVFGRLLQWMRRDWLRPLVMVGARSLDAYVIQAVALLAIPTLLAPRPWGGGLSTALVLTIFAGCWGWAEFRRRWGVDKLHRLPTILAEAAATPKREATLARA
ncbi:OpgC domain-containing protein [Gordonia phosphorivorans]|uniref:OpgC domain-containing protein n=1 Tax=Gordonia phosphorivorans TaxID=1056982 RepID=A0ABV6HAI3_9ACTN